MELYIKVAFWMGVIAIVINVVSMSVFEYPRQETKTLGSVVALTLVMTGFAFWTGSLLGYF